MISFPRDSDSPNQATDLVRLRYIQAICFCWLLSLSTLDCEFSRCFFPPLTLTIPSPCLFHKRLSGSCSLLCLLAPQCASWSTIYHALQMPSGPLSDLLHPCELLYYRRPSSSIRTLPFPESLPKFASLAASLALL